MGFARRFFQSTIKQQRPFIATWKTDNTSSGSSNSDQIKLPLINTGIYNFSVDWGDGNSDTITVWNQAETTHTYLSSGTYTITILGKLSGFAFGNLGDRLKILDIENWGDIIFTSQTAAFGGSFRGCSNLDITATDSPSFQPGAQIGFFSLCSSLFFNESINNWDVSPITNFSAFIDTCPNFNQPIGNWDVSNSLSFNVMFRNSSSFNQPIGNWDVSSATIFTGMFLGASNFNQNLSSWDVSSATNLSSMFRDTSFNNGGSDGINNWNVSNCTAFGGVNAGMFFNCPFNQPIGNWDVGKGINFSGMFFGNPNFNQNISNWNVSFGTNFATMFFSATSFNQNIGGWDVSKATDINQMFRNATSFDQNIGAWDVSKVTNFTNFMFQKTAANYSAANLDAIYNGWSALTLVSGRTISFGTIKYTAAGQAGRDILTGAPNNWTITDGGT